METLSRLASHGLDAILLNQGGALIVGLLVTFVILGDLKRLFSVQNLKVVLLLIPAVFLIDIVKWEHRGDEPVAKSGLLVAFRGLMMSMGLLALMAFCLVFRKNTARPSNIAVPGLKLLAVILVLSNIVTTLGRDPDDCGIYSNLGAQRWHETGHLPYGDDSLLGESSPGHGAAATYGPLLYACHIPVQLALGARNNAPDISPMQLLRYERPLKVATQLTALLLHFLGLLALYRIGCEFREPATRWALVALFAGSPYVIGLGGEQAWLGGADAFACGLSYISHIAPTSMVLLALSFRKRPVIAGACLATGAGMLYWPAFLFPVFLGWFWGRGGSWRFLAGFAAVGLLTTATVLLWTEGPDMASRARAFAAASFEHQEGEAGDQYGQSQYSFWGQHACAASFWKTSLVKGVSLFEPAFLLLVAMAFLSACLARGRPLGQFAFLIAIIAIGVQFWKTHAAGTYVEWHYPFLLIGLLCPTEPAPTPDENT